MGLYENTEVRAFPQFTQKTHYHAGETGEAMQVVSRTSVYINSAIEKYCSLVNNFYNTTGKMPGFTEELWMETLASELLDKFIEENNVLYPGFTKDKVRTVYNLPYDLFRDLKIAFTRSNTDPLYPHNLKKLDSAPIKPENVQTGWRVLIREFGFFSTLDNALLNITQAILSKDPALKSEDILTIVDGIIPDDYFHNSSNTDLKCPAHQLVKKHLALAVALNMSLVAAKKYSPETHISILKSADGNTHFRGNESMIEEYELKVA